MKISLLDISIELDEYEFKLLGITGLPVKNGCVLGECFLLHIKKEHFGGPKSIKKYIYTKELLYWPWFKEIFNV